MPPEKPSFTPVPLDYTRFVASLDAKQRVYLLQHQADAEARYQEAFRHATRLLSLLSSLQAEAVQHRIELPQQDGAGAKPAAVQPSKQRA